MQSKTGLEMKNRTGNGQMDQLIERGRQLHDQAVLDFFTWLISGPVRSARQYCSNEGVTPEDHSGSPKLSLRHT